MKKQGVLNSEISKVLSDLGHTDQICIADCGLPIPNGVAKIDLALKYGTPSYIEVLEEILKDLQVEEVILAREIKTQNEIVYDETSKLIGDVKETFVSHEEFKNATKNCKVIIRTGENTPYANIILQSGVYFGKEVK